MVKHSNERDTRAPVTRPLPVARVDERETVEGFEGSGQPFKADCLNLAKSPGSSEGFEGFKPFTRKGVAAVPQ
jgi:hypothetical protein